MIENTSNKLSFVVRQNRNFPFAIRFLKPEDIQLYLLDNGVQRKLDSSEFSVESREDYSEGATVTLLVDPLPVGATLTIIRVCEFTQDLSLPENGKLPSSGLERQLDKLTMIAQQLAEENSRCVKVGVTEESPDNFIDEVREVGVASIRSAEAAAGSAQVASNSAAYAEGFAASANGSANSAKKSADFAQQECQEAINILMQANHRAGHIGEYFLYPGVIPPPGAFLLNGQTIPDCRDAYKEFWGWVNSYAGEAVEVPRYAEWTMPALTEDGTLGGTEYAAALSLAKLDGYDAYKSFDNTLGGSKTFAIIGKKQAGILTWYSPVKLKITSLLFRNPTSGETSGRIVTFDVYASVDGANWDHITTGSLESTANHAEQTVVFPEEIYNAYNVGYHYIKIDAVNGGGTNMHFPEITVFGEEYLRTDTVRENNIRKIPQEAFDLELQQFGFCGAFVVDEESGDVRLPDLRTAYIQGSSGDNTGFISPETLPPIDLALRTDKTPATYYTVQLPEYGVNDNGGQIPTATTGSDEPMSLMSSAAKTNRAGDLIKHRSYGAGDRVRVNALNISFCIQVYASASPLGTLDSTQLVQQMQKKADLSLSNVHKDIDFIVKSERAADGSWWYDLYRSGKIDQGGFTSSAAGAVTVTFPVEFKDTSYNLGISDTTRQAGSNDTEGAAAAPFVSNYTVTTFRVSKPKTRQAEWRAYGIAATE